MQVEIVQAGRLELTNFTVEGLQSVVNITDMFLGLFLLIDRFITLPAFLPLSHIMLKVKKGKKKIHDLLSQ